MNVPQLRFSGFDGEWEPKTIKDLGIIGRGKSKHRPRNDARLYGTEYPFVQTADIKHAGLYLNSYSQAYSEFGLKQSKLWPKGTLCITIAANIAETAILDIEACFPDSIIGFTPDATKSEVVFIKKYFEFINPKLQKMSEGIAQSNLNLEKLASIEFTVPSLSEQKKIASFFVLLEKKIEKQQEKIEKLAQFKKGMMQKIFSQELRFKDEDGSNYSEWKEMEIGEISSIEKGTQINKSELEKNFSKGKYPVYNGGIITSGYYTKYNREPNSIIISEGGNSCGFVNFINEHFWSGGHCYTINPKENLINKQYLYQSLKKNEKSIMALRVGSGLPNIQKSALLKYKILVPMNLNEQKKIANYLMEIDLKVEKEKEKLMVLEEQKKGFMWGMFVQGH